MVTYVSLLRGVNVGGRKISMQGLKSLYESLNFTPVKTYIQSGNVIFNTDTEDFKEKIEDELLNFFGFEIPIFIKTNSEIQGIIKNNPFTYKDPTKIHVTFLSGLPSTIPVQEIDEVKDESEEFSVHQDVIYLYLPHGYGRTKLNNNFLEKKLGVKATTRNWRTVNKLYELSK